MTNPFVSLEQAAARMHRGVGPGSLLQAGQAWGVVAQKLVAAAEEMVLVITWCEGQYWQGLAAQQMREAINVVAQGLKDNAVVARQINTAATTVAAVFNKAQAATPTPQHVAENRQTRAQWAATDGVLGLHQWLIAELDTDYEVMWLRSMTSHGIYHHDMSHALARAEQTWWTPHQQPADASTTAEDRPPTPDAPDIPAQITQHRDTAAWCRIYALGHVFHAGQHQDTYEQHSTYAKTYKSLTDHDNAAVKLYNKMAQHHQDAAQLYRDLHLGQADISTLARKYVDIATTWQQTTQHMDEAIKVYLDASETLRTFSILAQVSLPNREL